MPPTGLVSFPGIQGLTQWSMTLSHGITPSVCMISAVPEGVNPAPLGNLTFTYDRTRFTLYDCLVDSANLSRDQSGNIVSLVILDKRWRWKFGSISGHYNRRKKDGALDLETEKTPQELAQLLFAEMKEFRFDVSMMPNDQRPECDWDYSVPAQELADLCDDLGCRIVLCLDNVVRILPIGTGNGLPNASTQVNADFGYDPPFHPDSITLVGAETRFQTKFKLERVGEDFDGSIKKIDDLSYKPSVGWGQAGFLGRIVNINESGLTFVQKETAKALANKTVNKWYRICATGNNDPGEWDVPGYYDDVTKRDQVLPLESGLVQTYIDSDGVERPRNAIVTGKYWNTSPDAKNLAGEQRVNIPFSIDEERGIVILSETLYKLSNGEVTAPDLWLTVAHGVTELETRQKIRVKLKMPLRDKPLGTGTYVIHREELQEKVIGAKLDTGSKTAVPQNSHKTDRNSDEVTRQMVYWINAAKREFQIEQTADLTYAGLLPISPDGAIQQVTWQSGPQGCYTRASRNSEHSRIVPSYKERRIADRAKQGRENARRIVKRVGRLFKKKGQGT